MRPHYSQRTDSRSSAPTEPQILFDIDWPGLASLVRRATVGTMYVLECDRLTTAFGPDIRVTMLVPRGILEDLAMLGLEPDKTVLAAHGGAALSVRDCEMTGYIDPLSANLRRALDVRGRSIASTISGMPQCDLIVLGGEAVDAAFASKAMGAIGLARPIIILRAPPPGSQVDAFRDLVAKLSGYRWLSSADFAGAAVVPFDLKEKIAVAWPIERQLPSTRSAVNATQRDLIARNYTPRPRFSIRDRSDVRPSQLDMPIDTMVATRGLWSLEQDETGDHFRWGGLDEKSSLYFEVPWPGKFSVSILFHPPVPTIKCLQSVCMINGVAVIPTYDDDKLIVTTNLFRHALVQLVIPPLKPAPGDPRRLTCCIRGIRIQEILP